jgi:hypothetical protein
MPTSISFSPRSSRRRRGRHRLLRCAASALAIGGLLATTGYAPPADACGRAIELEVEPATVLLSRAQKHLDRGEYLAAARKADESDDSPDLTWGQTWWRSRILATATIRSGGQVQPTIRWGRTTVTDVSAQQGNLKQAVATLKRMTRSKKHGDDPRLLSVLGEGLAQIPGRRAEALKVLTRLAEDDLITDARTYGALAELMSAEGQSEQAALARRQCEAMASDKATCRFVVAGVM